jgi:diaminohydroxyphosphoribosylaminopyrimidine deaminase / 5-amino-6-(5-phosphoribosylamino)uracil reductase
MSQTDYMRMALALARRGLGSTSPNPMVGAVLVKESRVIGRGWHRRAGEPHAEIEALRDAQQHGASPRGATLYVTLEPCCTQGRTPPCTEAIIAAGIREVIIGATDPNPRHCGRAFALLQRAGINVLPGVLGPECTAVNEVFNHWIVRRTPFVTVKAAMTLDGKIATAAGESKWITSEKARDAGMQLRRAADAILVGINTILADDPALTVRGKSGDATLPPKRRIILDSMARTPLDAQVVTDPGSANTVIIVGSHAPERRVRALQQSVRVLRLPLARNSASEGERINLKSLLKQLGRESVTSILVEGGGEVNASFLLGGLAQRIAFFYAPKVLGGRNSRCGVAGAGAAKLSQALEIEEPQWRPLGPDWFLSAKVKSRR